MRILPFLPSFSPSLVCHKNTKESFATIRSNSEHNPGEEEEDEEDEEGGEEGDEEYEMRRPQRKGEKLTLPQSRREGSPKLHSLEGTDDGGWGYVCIEGWSAAAATTTLGLAIVSHFIHPLFGLPTSYNPQNGA